MTLLAFTDSLLVMIFQDMLTQKMRSPLPVYKDEVQFINHKSKLVMVSMAYISPGMHGMQRITIRNLYIYKKQSQALTPELTSIQIFIALIF